MLTAEEVSVWNYHGPPPWDGEAVQFRLIYKGSLPSETSRPRLDAKRSIRSAFHPQLRELWSNHPALRWRSTFPAQSASGDERSLLELFADQHKVVSVGNHIHRFVPLVAEHNYAGCSLDVLFLRRDMPGGLITHGGDIDNRLKVLFDALRMPRESQEVDNSAQSADENPCFCLLADDKYIDRVSVTTDRLLLPMVSEEPLHDVLLVIHVSAALSDSQKYGSPVY